MCLIERYHCFLLLILICFLCCFSLGFLVGYLALCQLKLKFLLTFSFSTHSLFTVLLYVLNGVTSANDILASDI